jgi:hypothetical protein
MSFLELDKGIPDFSKAVISLWFRAPLESVIAAADNSLPTGADNFYMMQGILPLVTFGKPQQNKNYQVVYSEDIAHGDPFDVAVISAYTGWTNGPAYDVDPSFIGLDCRSDGTFKVEFNLQSDKKGSYNSLIWFATDAAYIADYDGPPPVGSGIVGSAGSWFQTTIVDGTNGIQDAQPEHFNVENGIKLKADVWHHVVLSFDVSGSCSVGEKPTSTCLMWYAIDDTNYNGVEHMGPQRDDDDELGPNAILTYTVYRESGVSDDPIIFYNNNVPNPSGGCSPGPLPSDQVDFAFPSSAKYVDAIFRVEMAEFQMWTGVTLDTGIEDNRRMFIKDNGRPELDYSLAEDVLGKPIIRLHKSGNWIVGHNTGSIGTDAEGKKIESGQFIPTAKTRRWKPDPSLHGPQNPGKKT